jgi:hypothetical protein
MLLSCLAYFRTLKTEKTCSFETSVDLQWTKRRYIQKRDRTLYRTLWSNACDLELKKYVVLISSETDFHLVA